MLRDVRSVLEASDEGRHPADQPPETTRASWSDERHSDLDLAWNQRITVLILMCILTEHTATIKAGQ